MSGCDTNLVTRDDLYKAKRQTQFIADVGTGGPTETVTNPDTGVVVPTLQKTLADLGWTHATPWGTDPLVTEALQVIPYNNQLFLPNTLPYQVDSTTHPDPNALVPSELRDVSKYISSETISNYTNLLFENVQKLKAGELIGGGNAVFELHQTLSTGFMSFRVSNVSGIELGKGLYAVPIGELMLGEFGLIPSVTDLSTAEHNAPILQEAVDLAIRFRKVLVGNGENYATNKTLFLAGVSVSANDLTVRGNNTKVINVVSGLNGFELNGRSHVSLHQFNCELPNDADGSGGACLEFKGTTGWNRIDDCVFRGGKHGIFSNNAPLFASYFEGNRIYNTYSSHVRIISDGLATTLTFRNNQTDGVASRDPAWYFSIANTGNGVENLELFMNSVDNCRQALFVRSRYANIQNFYVERVHGGDWQNGDRVFNIRDTFESGRVFGLRCTFISEVPASVTDAALLYANGFIVESCRLNGGLSLTSGQSTVITGAKTTELKNITASGGGAYGLYAGGPVVGWDQGSGDRTVDPSSVGSVGNMRSLCNLVTNGIGSGNNTGRSGVVFGIEDEVIPQGAISNGTINPTVNAYAAILPFATGGGTNRKGGLRFFTNNNSSTNELTAKWEINERGTFAPSTDDTVNIGGSSNRVDTIYLVNSPSVTSDDRYKEYFDIEEAENRAAQKIEKRKFRYSESIAKKGEGARYHFGYSAQQIIEAFESEGLNPFDYALIRKVPLIDVEDDFDISLLSEDEFRYEVLVEQVNAFKMQ